MRSALTASIKTKVRPAVVQIGLFAANLNGLDDAHLARCRAQLLEISGELDESHNKCCGNVLGQALVLAVAEGRNLLGLAIRVELFGVGNLPWVSSSAALEKEMIMSTWSNNGRIA